MVNLPLSREHEADIVYNSHQPDLEYYGVCSHRPILLCDIHSLCKSIDTENSRDSNADNLKNNYPAVNLEVLADWQLRSLDV